MFSKRRTLFCDEKLRRDAVEHTTVKAGCEYLKSRITSVRDKCVSTVKALLSVSQEDMCSDRRVAKYDSSHTTILSWMRDSVKLLREEPRKGPISGERCWCCYFISIRPDLNTEELSLSSSAQTSESGTSEMEERRRGQHPSWRDHNHLVRYQSPCMIIT